MRYVVEIETEEELKHTRELIGFVEWFLRNIAKMKRIKSIDARCVE